MRRIDVVAMLVERHARGVECLGGPTQVARGQCDLGFGNDASRAGHGFPGSERSCGASQQDLRPREVAELRHRDAAQCKRGRIVTQRDALERTERITRGQGTRGGRDQRIHRIPATLVTPTLAEPRLLYRMATGGRSQ
jgi:hypothetical protein